MGPLNGIRILEFAGLGPAPFCGMLLADMGADVVCVSRPPSARGGVAALQAAYGVMNRNKRLITLDLKSGEGVDTALRLVEKADALIEGLRPGVMEKLGLGPEACLERNARLIYGRMTGWGQQGPLAANAGHDINYIALSGALHAIGSACSGPVPPLNLVGDFGGGALYLAVGLLCGLLEARDSGRGQVVDCAVADGAAHLMAPFYGLLADGRWRDRRAGNLLDGGAHFYGCYRCADDKWLAVGAIEPQFYARLLDLTGASDSAFESQWDRERWPLLREKLAARFLTRTRDEWCALLQDSDACVSPVLSMTEAPDHPHHRARRTFVEYGGVRQPAPAPRFGRSPTEMRPPPADPEAVRLEILEDWGLGS